MWVAFSRVIVKLFWPGANASNGIEDYASERNASNVLVLPGEATIEALG